jgi:hypothetical protein
VALREAAEARRGTGLATTPEALAVPAHPARTGQLSPAVLRA